MGRSAVQNAAGHRSLGEGPNRSEILQVSQALKLPLEESTVVQCKLVEDTSLDDPLARTNNRRRRLKRYILTVRITQLKTKVLAQ